MRLELGYDAYAVIDDSGTFSETNRITGLLRMVSGGGGRHDYSTSRESSKTTRVKSRRSVCGLDMPLLFWSDNGGKHCNEKDRLKLTLGFHNFA